MPLEISDERVSVLTCIRGLLGWDLILLKISHNWKLIVTNTLYQRRLLASVRCGFFHRWVPTSIPLNLRQRDRMGEVAGTRLPSPKASSSYPSVPTPVTGRGHEEAPVPLWRSTPSVSQGWGWMILNAASAFWNLSPNLAQTPLCPLLSPRHPWILILNNGTSNLANCVSLKITRRGRCVGSPCFHFITLPNALPDTFHLFFNFFTIKNDN